MGGMDALDGIVLDALDTTERPPPPQQPSLTTPPPTSDSDSDNIDSDLSNSDGSDDSDNSSGDSDDGDSDYDSDGDDFLLNSDMKESDFEGEGGQQMWEFYLQRKEKALRRMQKTEEFWATIPTGLDPAEPEFDVYESMTLRELEAANKMNAKCRGRFEAQCYEQALIAYVKAYKIARQDSDSEEEEEDSESDENEDDEAERYEAEAVAYYEEKEEDRQLQEKLRRRPTLTPLEQERDAAYTAREEHLYDRGVSDEDLEIMR